MAAGRCEISLLVLENVSLVRCAHSRNNSTLEDKFRFSTRPCNIFYLLYKHQWNTRWAFARKLSSHVKISPLLWLHNIKSRLSHQKTVQVKWFVACSQRQWLHSSVGRASHRYREVTGSNTVEVLNFFEASLRNCINRVHCEDHFFIFKNNNSSRTNQSINNPYLYKISI